MKTPATLALLLALTACTPKHWTPAMAERANRDAAYADRIGNHRCDGVNDWDDQHGPNCDRRKRYLLGFIQVRP